MYTLYLIFSIFKIYNICTLNSKQTTYSANNVFYNFDLYSLFCEGLGVIQNKLYFLHSTNFTILICIPYSMKAWA